MKKYKARLNKREFVNYPGHHDGAYIVAYVEDTSGRELEKAYKEGYFENPHPRIILEMADCSKKVNFEFEIYTGNDRQNTFHKVDGLIKVLTEFRDALAEESIVYKQRQRKLDAIDKARKAKADNKDAKSKDEWMTPDEFLDSLREA
jgi:hypothetical protein